MKRRVVAAAALAVLVCQVRPARADCDEVTQQLFGELPRITNQRLKVLLSFDIDHAVRELAEGDEMECAQVIDHAIRLLMTMPHTAEQAAAAGQAPLPPAAVAPSQNVTRTPP